MSCTSRSCDKKVKSKNPGQMIIFESALQVDFDHRIECAWTSFLSHRQELSSPRYPVRGRLKLFDDTALPLRCRNMDDDRGDDKETPDNTTTDAEDDHPGEEKNTEKVPQLRTFTKWATTNLKTQTVNRERTREGPTRKIPTK